MRFLCVTLLLMLVAVTSGATPSDSDLESLKQHITNRFSSKHASQWGENVTGVHTRLKAGEKIIALTLDACGSAKGKGYDAALIDFLIEKQIPATLFVNARWIDANPDVFRSLTRNPLFEIANHGLRHKPASSNGRSAYGIKGTGSIAELVEEIESNARKIEALTGRRPGLYRSGTAFYDEVAVAVAQALRHDVAGYSVLGDAGATYTSRQVAEALLASKPGDIILCHFNHPEGGTAEGLKSALPQLKNRGFRFVRMSDSERN